MISNIFKIIGGIFVTSFLLIGVLGAIKQPIDSNTLKNNTLAKASLGKNKDRYANCKNSLGLGKTKIYQVTRSYMTADTTEPQDQQVRDVEAKFIKKIENECSSIIKNYEANFETYETTTTEIAKADTSLLDDILGIDNTPDESDFFEYQPSSVSLFTAAATDNLVFSEQDIRIFYEQNLGR